MLSRQKKAELFRRSFFGRQDVFGRRWESSRADGTTFSGYAPVCQNLWSERCGLRNKTSGCDGCSAKQYEPVSDESVLRHIEGKESQIQYVLQTDGTIFFGALDFDRKQKPGKEHLDYQWEDVCRTTAILREWGLPYVIATSTGHGWHVYFFFDGPYPANRFRAVMIELFERAGFMEKMRLGIRQLCEIFPKQSYIAPDSIGNGIKTPCIEPNWVNGKNGFIDDSGVFIPPEKQWEYLESVPRITSAQLDALIAKYEIPVYEDGPAESTVSCGAPLNGERRDRGSWQPALSGSIEKVLLACPTFKKIRERVLAGEVLGHQEGFALYRLCLNVADGLSWFTTHVKGWGTNPSELKQLEHSLKKNYSPDSCIRLQANGVCPPGTKCLSKRPPIDQVEGRSVVRSDLPESQWPDPSPIRFAFGGGDDFLDALKLEATCLKDEEDQEKRAAALEALFKRAQVFDQEQQKDFKKYVKDLRLVKPGEMSKLFSKAVEEAQKESEAHADQRNDTVKVCDNYYKKLTPYGYALLKISRSRTKENVLCTVDISVEEERTYIDDGKVISTVFKGKCAGPGVKKEFELSHDKWIENSDFAKYFLATLGNVFNVQRVNVDPIRQAAMAFSQQAGIGRSSHLITQGWYNQSYLTPTVIVDKEGVRPNTEQHVTLAGKDHAKNIDFSLLSDGQFTEVMLHIKKDLLNAWPRFWVMFGLSHTLLPAILRPLGLDKKRPTLFYEGLTGSGKTEITHLMQQFWGSFVAPLNLTSSAKGLMEEAYQFKDSLLVIDDYKGIDRNQIDTLKRVIQYSYDGTVAAKLNRDSSLQKERGSRATLMMSGEEFLQAEASAIARTILLEVDKYNTAKTREAYTRSWQMSSHYRGVTPRFIHWFLNQDIDKAKKDFEGYHAELQMKTTGKQNSSRIATNLSMSYVAWSLWTSFMQNSGVLSAEERKALMEEQWNNIQSVQMNMLARCETEQSALVFLNILREIIATKEVSIYNLDGWHNDRKQLVGFVAPTAPDVVNLFPEMTIMAVRTHAKNPVLGGTNRSIAKQLADMKILIETEDSRLTKLVRYGGQRQRVWPVRMEELGFEIKPELKIVPTHTPQAKPDESGIL